MKLTRRRALEVTAGWLNKYLSALILNVTVDVSTDSKHMKNTVSVKATAMLIYLLASVMF